MDEDTNVATAEPEVGWIAAQQQTQPCHEIGKRHSYKGGEICLKCGMPKPVHVPRERSAEPTERAPRGSSGVVRQFEGLLSMAWMAMGVGIATQDRVMPDVAEPVGRVLQFQAPVAGKRIKSALSKTPAWKPILAMMRHVGPWTDLAPLIGPPIFVGLIAWKPRLKNQLMPFLLPMMMPLAQEVQEMADEQKALVANIEDMQERAVNAYGLIESILQTDESRSSVNGSVPQPA